MTRSGTSAPRCSRPLLERAGAGGAQPHEGLGLLALQAQHAGVVRDPVDVAAQQLRGARTDALGVHLGLQSVELAAGQVPHHLGQQLVAGAHPAVHGDPADPDLVGERGDVDAPSGHEPLAGRVECDPDRRPAGFGLAGEPVTERGAGHRCPLVSDSR
jgi:hypothetical protein